MSTAYLAKKAQIVEVKQGDTLVLGCVALDSTGATVDLTGITVKAQMRDAAGALVVDLVYQHVNEAIGSYDLWHPGDSLVVAPVGEYTVDIQYEASDGSRDIVRSTRTFYVRVLEGVTA